MKELSIEEKAKAYDEAIEKAKKVKDNPFAGYDGSDVISFLFPELKDGLIAETINYHKASHFAEPVILTSEILEKNGFNANGFTNLSPDYYYKDDLCSILINLKSTCDKSKSIYVANKKTRVSVTIEESRHSHEKKPLMVHQLQQAIKLCGIDKKIESLML